jgi:hypothetical protein
MKKLRFLPMILVLALLVAACSPEETEPGAGTPGVGTPDAFATPADPLGTPVVPVTPEVTPEVDVTPAATPETTPIAPDETPVAVTDPDESPHRASNMLDFDVRNYEDETLGNIEELIVSLSPATNLANAQTTGEQQQTPAGPGLDVENGEQISYVIVNVGGFLGIGQRQIAIPFETLQLQTGEDENDYAFYLDANQEQLEALPEVDLDQLDFTAQDWDLQLRTGWDTSFASPGQQQTPAAPADETPATPETTPTPGGTPAPGVTPDETEQAGRHIYALRVSVLLGSEVYDQLAAAPGQPVEPMTELTPGAPGEGQPGAPATGTPAPGETPAPVAPPQPGQPGAPGMIPDQAMVVATVEDLIVDPNTGVIEYAILDVDGNLELGDRWIPVPLNAMNILGADDLLLGMGIEYLVQVDRQQLVEAPSFEVGVLPVVEDPNWDAGVRDYWDIQ